MLVEPILKINCKDCKLCTEHLLSKNVKGDSVYRCLRCGQDIAFQEALGLQASLENDLPTDNSVPIGVA